MDRSMLFLGAIVLVCLGFVGMLTGYDGNFVEAGLILMWIGVATPTKSNLSS